MWIFAPLFVITILVTFTLVGNRFRKHQTPTDLNMGYEKATKAAKTVVENIIIPMELLMEKNDIKISQEFKDNKAYMIKIMGKKL